MRTIRLAAAVLSVVLSSAVVGAGPATAATSLSTNATLPAAKKMSCSAPVGTICTPAAGNRVVGSVSWYRSFRSVTQVCATIRFTSNLVDPGEEVDIAFTSVADGYSGFVNAGSTPISSRTLCWTNASHPEITDLFRDGTQNFTLFMGTRGSAQVASVRFTLTY
jgi:hypothetical protein